MFHIWCEFQAKDSSSRCWDWKCVMALCLSRALIRLFNKQCVNLNVQKKKIITRRTCLFHGWCLSISLVRVLMITFGWWMKSPRPVFLERLFPPFPPPWYYRDVVQYRCLVVLSVDQVKRSGISVIPSGSPKKMIALLTILAVFFIDFSESIFSNVSQSLWNFESQKCRFLKMIHYLRFFSFVDFWWDPFCRWIVKM